MLHSVAFVVPFVIVVLMLSSKGAPTTIVSTEMETKNQNYLLASALGALLDRLHFVHIVPYLLKTYNTGT